MVDLAIAVIGQALNDINSSSSINDLECAYGFFRSDDFIFWCSAAEIGDSSIGLLEEVAYKKYCLMKSVFSTMARLGDYRIVSGIIFPDFCIRRAEIVIRDICSCEVIIRSGELALKITI